MKSLLLSFISYIKEVKEKTVPNGSAPIADWHGVLVPRRDRQKALWVRWIKYQSTVRV